MVISGDTYFDRGSMLTLVQGYIYSDTIISYSVNNLGVTKIDHLYAINVNGYLTFWFSRINYWQSYKIEVYRSSAGDYRKNHAISVVNSEKPAGTKEIDLCGNKYTNAYISDLTWGNIGSKPETATRWPSWNEITSKPSTFTPSDHSHNYLPLSGGTLTGELDVNSILKICEPNDPLAGRIHTKLLCYSSSPYGIIFRGYASGTHSIQVQRESNDSERFNLSLQPLGGNVGVGTTSPGARLEVNGGVHLNSSGSEQNIDFRKDGSYRNEISSNGTNFVFWSNTTGDGNGWRQDLVIRRSDGYVGIGTNDPTNKLHIVGSTKHEGTIVLENSAYFLGAPSYGFRFNDHNSNYNNFIIYENGNTYTRGNVGIGTTSPSYKLDVNGSANSTTLYENGNRVITTANIGSQSVNYATSAGNADTVDNRHATYFWNYKTPSKSSGSWDVNEVLGDTIATWAYGFAESTSVIHGPVGDNVSDARAYYTLGGVYCPLQLSWYYTNSASLYARTYYNGTWYSWKKIAFTEDIPSTIAWSNVTGKPDTYTPSSHTHSYLPLSGGTLTGQLRAPLYIMNNGTTYLDVSGSSLVVSPDGTNRYTVWHAGNDGSGSGLDADLLDGYHYSDIIKTNGRNLIHKYDVETSTSGYMAWETHVMTERVEPGDQLTMTVEYSLPTTNATKTWISAYSGGGYASFADFTATPGLSHHIESRTFNISYASGHDDNGICIYYGPSDKTGTMTVHRVKIERGNRFTGWSSAPEDNLLVYRTLTNSEIDNIIT